MPYIPERTNILRRSLIHFSVYFCAFLVRTDLQCSLTFNFFEIKSNFEKIIEMGSGVGAEPPHQYIGI